MGKGSKTQGAKVKCVHVLLWLSVWSRLWRCAELGLASGRDCLRGPAGLWRVGGAAWKAVFPDSQGGPSASVHLSASLLKPERRFPRRSPPHRAPGSPPCFLVCTDREHTGIGNVNSDVKVQIQVQLTFNVYWKKKSPLTATGKLLLPPPRSFLKYF